MPDNSNDIKKDDTAHIFSPCASFKDCSSCQSRVKGPKNGEFLENQPLYGEAEPEQNTGTYFLLSAVVILAVSVVLAVIAR